MKISCLINKEARSLSFEVFPPKSWDKYESVSSAVKEIASLSPSYMSVTFGACGGASEYTAKIASEVMSYGVTSLAHLTCISSTEEQIDAQLNELKRIGVENILALRGDIPEGLDRSKLSYRNAYELIDKIRSFGDFCIGGACYPESHPESKSPQKDLEYLKMKVDHGCDFLTTQMFFDNDIYYRFVENARRFGIDIPIIPGIMPITSYAQLNKMVLISGNQLPVRFIETVDKYKDDPISFKNACVEYAIMQASDIYENGFNAVHVYSMNKPDVAKEIKSSLGV